MFTNLLVGVCCRIYQSVSVMPLIGELGIITKELYEMIQTNRHRYSARYACLTLPHVLHSHPLRVLWPVRLQYTLSRSLCLWLPVLLHSTPVLVFVFLHLFRQVVFGWHTFCFSPIGYAQRLCQHPYVSTLMSAPLWTVTVKYTLLFQIKSIRHLDPLCLSAY